MVSHSIYQNTPVQSILAFHILSWKSWKNNDASLNFTKITVVKTCWQRSWPTMPKMHAPLILFHTASYFLINHFRFLFLLFSCVRCKMFLDTECHLMSKKSLYERYSDPCRNWLNCCYGCCSSGPRGSNTAKLLCFMFGFRKKETVTEKCIAPARTPPVREEG